jgi:hypothetical protein
MNSVKILLLGCSVVSNDVEVTLVGIFHRIRNCDGASFDIFQCPRRVSLDHITTYSKPEMDHE